MNKDDNISFDELNYLIDGQISQSERARVLDKLKKDDDLSKTLCELQRNDEFVSLSYAQIPEPKYNPYHAATRKKGRNFSAIAASLLIVLSASISWQINSYVSSNKVPDIMSLTELGNYIPNSKKVLIHVSEMNDESIKSALDKTEVLLNKNKDNIQVEIIANENGLALLRNTSPYANRIKSLSNNFHNLKFKACGIAMNVAKLKEGKDVELLPEAEKVPAALDEILKRLKERWSYFKV